MYFFAQNPHTIYTFVMNPHAASTKIEKMK